MPRARRCAQHEQLGWRARHQAPPCDGSAGDTLRAAAVEPPLVLRETRADRLKLIEPRLPNSGDHVRPRVLEASNDVEELVERLAGAVEGFAGAARHAAEGCAVGRTRG